MINFSNSYVKKIVILSSIIFIISDNVTSQSPFAFEDSIFFLPKNNLLDYCRIHQKNSDPIYNYCNRLKTSLEQIECAYFCWTQKGAILCPDDCNNLSGTENQSFKNLFYDWSKLQPDTFLISIPEMRCFQLYLLNESRTSCINQITDQIRESHNVIFYIFEYKRSDNLRFNYYTTHPIEEHKAKNQIERSKADFIYRTLKNIKSGSLNDRMQIAIQGHLKDRPMFSNIPSLYLGCDPLYQIVGSPKKDGVRFHLNPPIQPGSIWQLECEGIYINNYSSSIVFNTTLFDDIINKSTVEKDGDGQLFILTYLKTSDFVCGNDTISKTIKTELINFAAFVNKYYQDYQKSGRTTDQEYVLYLSFTGFADNSDIRNKNLSKKNRELSANRSNVVRKWFSNNLQINRCQFKLLKAERCDEKYFDGSDRSVEVKMWIRDTNDIIRN